MRSFVDKLMTELLPPFAQPCAALATFLAAKRYSLAFRAKVLNRPGACEGNRMPGKIITDGDTITFDLLPAQSASKQLILNPPLPRITGTGFATINQKKICVSADAQAFVCAFQYTTPAFEAPGSGIIKITQAPNAPYVTTPDSMQALVQDPPVQALVIFQVPATNPETGAPDPNIEPIEITGTFTPQNQLVSAQ